jgi:hypothetical protein
MVIIAIWVSSSEKEQNNKKKWESYLSKLFGYSTVLGSSGYKLIKNTEPSKYDFLLR